MSAAVIKIEDLKIENIRLSQVKANKKGGKTVYINYIYNEGEEPKKLRFQLPRMKAPFGISGWSVSSNGENSSIPNEMSNDAAELAFSENHQAIIHILEKLEEFMVQTAFENSKEFFNKKKTLEVCKMFFTSAIKHTLDDNGEKSNKYPPRFRCKLNKNADNAYTVQVYNSKKEKVDMDIYNYNSVLPKMSECVTIIECSGLWIVGEKFGISFRPAQMKVYKNETSLTDYAFVDEEEHDEDTHQESDNEIGGEISKSVEAIDLGIDETEENDPLEASSRRRRKN
jgi:hypothetical protein